MSVRVTKVDEFKFIKNSPRSCTLDDFRLMADAEWWSIYRSGIPKHYQIQLYHLIGRCHRSYVQNGRESPWNDDLSLRAQPEPIPMPISPNALPAPDEATLLPDTIRGPKSIELARQILGFFYEKKPLMVHNIIRKLEAHGVEEETTRAMVYQLKKSGVLANPEKGVYAVAEVANV